MLTGDWNSLEFTSAIRNDQQDSKETIDQIQKGSLNIRDLGYITTTYLKAISEKEAYFLNRLPKIGVFIKKDNENYNKLNWKKLDKEMKSGNFEEKELEVYISEKDKIKCRMIIKSVPEKVKNERIRKSAQGGKRTKGYQLTDEHKIKAGYTIYITNVPQEKLSSAQIGHAYRLRWQIELVFKVWKSNLKIHKIKPMKLERMLCQLYAKFIWILLNANILKLANRILQRKEPTQVCSPTKYYKRAKTFSKELRYILDDNSSFFQWFTATIMPLITNILTEQRLNQPTHNQLLYSLFLS